MTDLQHEFRVEATVQRSAGLRQALDLVGRGIFRGAGPARCVPSAGAIFPYDVVVLVRRTDGEEAKLFRLDFARRAAVLLPVPGDLVEHLLASPGPPSGAVTADLIVLTRPWLSMRKYGHRGYLYAQLDAGHVSTNLLGTALDTGSATLRLRIPRRQIMDQLWGLLPYREVHSVVSIGPAPQATGQPAWSSFRQYLTPGSDNRCDLERYCWSGIPRQLVEGSGAPGPVVDEPLIQPPVAGAGGAVPIRRGEWGALSQLRRSCKQFSELPPPGQAVAEAMGALATPLPTDVTRPTDDARNGGLQITLAAVPGPLADACRAPALRAGVNVVVSDRLTDREAVRYACMGQQHLSRAPAFVICHVKRHLLLAGADGQTVRDAVYRAATAVQLLYLGATRSSVAVTAIGGQDVAAWRQLVDLPEDDELLYLLALGLDQAGMSKHDRAELAHAHGE
ncbi:hypothetical protein [Plantactinospora sp. DSM 117369]